MERDTTGGGGNLVQSVGKIANRFDNSGLKDSFFEIMIYKTILPGTGTVQQTMIGHLSITQ